MRRVVFIVLAGALFACSQSIEPPRLKPQVSLTVQSTTVIGASIKGAVTASGCSKTRVDVLGADQSFILDTNFAGNPTPWELDSASLGRFYPAGGLALQVSLIAKVTCLDDGRANVSAAVDVSFFPVTSVVSEAGVAKLPERFVATGGVAGGSTSFIGCSGNNELVRADTAGTVNLRRPFTCSYASTISERNNVTRWLLEPGIGAFAFDDELRVTNRIMGSVRELAVASDGSAVLWVDGVGSLNRIVRALAAPPTFGALWSVEFPGPMVAPPAIDTGSGTVAAASWQSSEPRSGKLAVLKYALADGSVVNADSSGKVPVLIAQDFGEDPNRQIVPTGTFNLDGSLLYLTLYSFPGGSLHSTVVACAIVNNGCDVGVRRWASEAFETKIERVLPFSLGNFIAAASETEVYFLRSSDGSTLNLGGAPLRPSAGLSVLGLQAGRGADFYLLNGPAGGYPNELIATDAPTKGGLWKLAVGTGSTPTNGLYLDVDTGGQPWVRVGNDLVRPLSNERYRELRGPTPR